MDIQNLALIFHPRFVGGVIRSTTDVWYILDLDALTIKRIQDGTEELIEFEYRVDVMEFLAGEHGLIM